MIDDPFNEVTDTITSPARDCFSIVANDAQDLARATKAIYVGDGGTITLRAVGSQSDVTLTNVPSGAILPIRVRAVRVTGTSAANIVGLA
jgi:hypothetical protein